MTSRLPNTFAALSLLMCVAVSALWVRGYSRADVIIHSGSGRTCSLIAGDGRLWLEWRRISYRSGHVRDGFWYDWYPRAFFRRSLPEYRWLALGFDASVGRLDGDIWCVTTIIPYWFLAFLFLVPCLWWVRRKVHMRRQAGRQARGFEVLPFTQGPSAEEREGKA